MSGRRVPLAGSHRVAPEGATPVGDVDPEERIAIVIHVKRRTPDRFQPGSAGDLARLARPIKLELDSNKQGEGVWVELTVQESPDE